MKPVISMAPVVGTKPFRTAIMWITWLRVICITITMVIAITMAPSKQPKETEKPTQQRNTRQKAAIREVFLAMDRPLGPQEVLEHAGSRTEGLGIATVYRNIKGLMEEGWLVPVELPGEPARYEVAGKAHHHHFHCESCQRVYDLPGCPISVKLTLPAGYISTRHEVVLYGRCPACA